MRILFIGDIVGKPGRTLVQSAVRPLVSHHGIDLVVANVENAAGGNGITREIGESLRDCGIDVMTGAITSGTNARHSITFSSNPD